MGKIKLKSIQIYIPESEISASISLVTTGSKGLSILSISGLSKAGISLIVMIDPCFFYIIIWFIYSNCYKYVLFK